MISIIKNILMNRVVLIVLAASTLQSCFVAKEYQRPEFEETTDLYRTDNLPQDSLSMADVSWKEMFTDPYLIQYIEEGLQNNLDIRVAIQQMAAAEAYMKQGKAGYLPSLSAGASMTHQELSKNSQFGSFFNGAINQYEITGNLSWEADIWGKIRSNKRAGEASYLQSVSAHQAVKTELIASIATTYYSLLALDSQKAVTEQTIAARESSVTTIQALKDAGQVNQVAVDGNIAQYNNAKALLIDVEVAIFQTENTLNLLLGRPAQEIQRTQLDGQNLQAEIKLGVPATLLRNRPDVMASEYALINAFELTNVAKSNFYPSLTITASGGLQSLELDELINVNSLFANIVGGLAQPIFNKRAIKTQHEVALAQQEQALLNFKRALLVSGNEVSNALYNYDALTEKYDFREKEVEALRQAETNSEELLVNGYATYLDLLTARQNALSAELNLIDNKLQQLLSVVNLYKALGGGWK
ncbi:efflux transporter outer membrane subunit [Mangrovimonas sp. AS39]|uniref:efflux transporter outer membrane subunit n=1 Tax=Mangrovimonas TaxID=1211036 RepID=UPI001424765D|nr:MULTISPECIES: efflux transporter outer membrane subunit [Mangrovimonas]MCF1190486.1 efflux transporter outer membrane subunit [Mangrovimonas futianensis]MCF1193762.1 efflux transporter outer membrane subunit [Mangrovimonas futianensis]MCF1420729.1 efflux transporter outer membrane subunit [Mangrovimonas futianensis]NIK91033.1 efflux transporter outer membrane subunit [Mangrovimonas sp. CR14]